MKAVKLITLAVTAVLLSGCAHGTTKSSEQSVGKLPIDNHTYKPTENADVAASKTQVIKQYVPVPVPGQLMPIPKNDSSASDTKPSVAEAAVQQANKNAVVEPNSQQFFNAMMTYDYMPGAMYTIYTAPLAITDIQFQPGEKIISEAAGDTLRWQVSQTYSGDGSNLTQHILVKPSMAGLNNTMVVTTNMRVYHLVLKSTADNTYMVSVSWQYPGNMVQMDQSNDATMASSLAASGGSPYQLDLATLDFNYKFGMAEGSTPAWYPVRIFNDGRQTFIQFPDNFSATDLPVLMIADNNGNYGTMVNWRLKGKYMIVDTVINNARLQTGIAKTGETIVQIQHTQ